MSYLPIRTQISIKLGMIYGLNCQLTAVSDGWKMVKVMFLHPLLRAVVNLAKAYPLRGPHPPDGGRFGERVGRFVMCW